MFQSDDEITFDADFLSDAFDLASTTSSVECPKRPSEQAEGQPLKKLCVNSSQNKDTQNILSILRSQPKQSENSVRRSPDHRFIRPNKERRVVVRKFPGPAGLLPAQKKLVVDLKNLDNFDSVVEDKSVDNDELLCSQQSEDVFTRPAWRRMLADLTLPPGPGGAPGVVLPERYTIAWTKACATNKRLVNGKIPFLAAVVQQVDCSTRGPMVVLKDRTGEIQATLIHEVWEKYADYIHAGVVIVLRHIGVLSTGKRHYLAITLNNLVTIYGDQDETGNSPVTSQTDPVITKVNYMTSSDFIKTIADVQFAKLVEPPCELPENNPFFRTSASGNNINSMALFSDAECSSKMPTGDGQARRDIYNMNTNSLELFSVAERSSRQPNASSELFATAEGYARQPLGDNTTRSDTQPRRDTHKININSLELFTNAECSSQVPTCDIQARRDTQPRRDTPNINANSLELFATAESCSKQPLGDSSARSDTHNRPINAYATKQLSNQANNFTFKPKLTIQTCNTSVISDTPTFLRSDFDKSTEKSSKLSQESEMLSQVFDGLDAESIFDEF